MSPRTPLAFGALVTALLLASCSTPAPKPAPPSSASASAEPSTAATTAAVDDETPAVDAEPACDTIITSGTVDALTSQGWTSKHQELRIGETLIENGLLCMWADFSTASDHGQMYGWGALDERTSETAQSNLKRDGWLRSTEGEIVYFTEDPAYAIATDEDGFGMTYEFGDGWVKFADTKQGLLLIDWKG
ncbi:hypothetical protein FVO59_12720 [Microbacterium esteraromaticum]|uniref:Nitrate ABC transporter substrate-binding protein n=1 Tax=Microbacterium esteraromaticum TaxID=57043 RepID=A0A7D8AM85_9MICO|nr:hypothetical protein [Microbacterium esteraromaticum]QMU97967.1 hypothetical protein FVO59_12720 [Microbacterium esteraromaticum]